MEVKKKIIDELEVFQEKELSEILDFIEFMKAKHLKEIPDITMASEEILKEEWLSPEEEKAWEDL